MQASSSSSAIMAVLFLIVLAQNYTIIKSYRISYVIMQQIVFPKMILLFTLISKFSLVKMEKD